MIRRFVWLLPLMVLTIVVQSPLVGAQGSCPALVDAALAALDDNCASSGRNTACYGYNQVSATFLDTVAEDFFTQPADQAQVRLIESIGTSAMNVEDRLWGVALLNLQANIPNTIPGQSVKFVLIGDAEMENAVAQEAVFTPGEGVPVIATDRINIRSAPSLNANVLTVSNVDEQLLVDGISENGAWLRVTRNNTFGWFVRDLVRTEADLDVLPVITEETRTPMQAFYLRTGVGAPACEEAPQDALLVQGPDGMTVEFSANGADFRLSSTLLLRILPDEEFMEVIVLAGEAEVDGVVIRAGQRSRLCLSPTDNRGLDGEANDRIVTCEPSTPEPVGDYTGWCTLGSINDGVLNYGLPIDCVTGLQLFEPDPVPPQPVSGDAPTPPQQVTGPIDCSGLRPTSPLGQAPEGNSVFYWDGLYDYDIDAYIVTVINDAGEVVSRVETDGNSTNAEVGFLPFLRIVSWQVEAIVDGQVVCAAGTTPMQVVGNPALEPPPPVVPPAPVLTANWSCSTDNQIFINWANATPSGNVSVTFIDILGPQTLTEPSDASGGGFKEFNICDMPISGSVTDLVSGAVSALPTLAVNTCPGFVGGC